MKNLIKRLAISMIFDYATGILYVLGLMFLAMDTLPLTLLIIVLVLISMLVGTYFRISFISEALKKEEAPEVKILKKKK